MLTNHADIALEVSHTQLTKMLLAFPFKLLIRVFNCSTTPSSAGYQMSMVIGQLHGNLHGGGDQAVPHQQQVCKTICLWGSHLESVQRMLGYQLNHLEPRVNHAKKVALHKPTSLVTAYFPRSVMRLPDVNQIMRTHIAVPCQIGINAGRGEGQNWTTIISSGQFL